jgi:hypothetical protein
MRYPTGDTHYLDMFQQTYHVRPRGTPSGGRSLTRPFRDARRNPSPRIGVHPLLSWVKMQQVIYLKTMMATPTPRNIGMCASFKRHFLSPRAKP